MELFNTEQATFGTECFEPGSVRQVRWQMMSGLQAQALRAIIALELAVVFCFVGQVVEQDLRRLASIFAAVDVPNRLFDVGDGFVLRVVEDGGMATEFQLAPKHYYRGLHPDWTEPDVRPRLTPVVVSKIVAEIGKVKPLGKVLRRGTKALVSNNRAPYVDVYENGVLQRVEWSPVIADSAGTIASCRLVYFEEVSGTVTDLLRPAGLLDEYRVAIDGRWYWVKPDVLTALSIGTKITARAAGPVDTEWGAK